MFNLDKIKEEFKIALSTGDAEKVAEAFQNYSNALVEELREAQTSNDNEILARRGVRVLTKQEKDYYNGLIKAFKSPNAKQELSKYEVAMPETIINDTLTDLKTSHPLLDAINFRNVSFLTKWILNDGEKKNAKWGAITSKVTEEIEGAFKEIDVKQNKLTCFFLLSQDLVDLGPSFLDAYVREVLSEAVYSAFEDSIVNGNGKDQFIGMTMNLSSESGGEYTAKTVVKMNDIDKDYLVNVAKLAKTEKGINKTFSNVILVVNMTTYLTKILPAVQFRVPSTGQYVNDQFPFATEVIISNAIADDRAVLGLKEKYLALVGRGKDPAITYDDSYKFLEDQRTFKAKLYATGRPYDNTDFLYLDVSKLKAYTLKVEQVATAPGA